MPVYNINTIADLNTSCTFGGVYPNYTRNNQCSTFASNINYTNFSCSTGGWCYNISWCTNLGWACSKWAGCAYSVNCSYYYKCLASNYVSYIVIGQYTGQAYNWMCAKIDVANLISGLPASSECFNICQRIYSWSCASNSTVYTCQWSYVGALLIHCCCCACYSAGQPQITLDFNPNITFQCIGADCWEVFCDASSKGCVSTNDILNCFCVYSYAWGASYSGSAVCTQTLTGITCLGTTDTSVCVTKCIPDANLLFCENRLVDAGNTVAIGNYVYADVAAINRISPVGPVVWCSDGTFKCALNYGASLDYGAGEYVGFNIANKQRSTGCIGNLTTYNGYVVPFSNYNTACIANLCRILTC